MPATTPRRPLRDIFRHGGIELSETEAESHRDALARLAQLDRQLEALDLRGAPIPLGTPWAGELWTGSHER
jgi:hypothetical protein